MQDSVCLAGTVQVYNPELYKRAVVSNGEGLPFVNAAIFAVNVVGGGGKFFLGFLFPFHFVFDVCRGS